MNKDKVLEMVKNNKGVIIATAGVISVSVITAKVLHNKSLDIMEDVFKNKRIKPTVKSPKEVIDV